MSAAGARSRSFERRYTSGEYARDHPTWHVEHSPWKATQVMRMIERNRLRPTKVVEVGCGAGEILRTLHDRMPGDVSFLGYEISPDAHALAVQREGPRLGFRLADFLQSREDAIDLLLVMDVVEHVEDYLGFLRALQPRASHTIFHIPLDLTAEWMMRHQALIAERHAVGHLHYFTKDLAFEALRDTGFEVLDAFYTPWAIDFLYPSWSAALRAPAPVKTTLRKALQHSLYAASPDLAARLARGWSLLVLAS